MKAILYLFRFLGGIYLAIILIATTALMVAIGTFLESKTGSHLFAAQWTYHHPFFFLLLWLFFINILLSAFRRCPFKKKHIPFLMTHLGLLMIIGGTIVKQHYGLQGDLSIWEGSGNDQVVLPFTYALHIEKKSDFLNGRHSLLPLNTFRPNIYYPFHYPTLKCKLIGYAAHVKENVMTWIKDSKTSIAGFPSIPVLDWKPLDPLPSESLHQHPKDSQKWSLIALRTSHVPEALQKAYLRGLQLEIKFKDQKMKAKKIPLERALEKFINIDQISLSTSLDLLYFIDLVETPALNIEWTREKADFKETIKIPLNGSQALEMIIDSSSWVDPPFTIDLCRPDPVLCLVEDDHQNNFLFVFDSHGRVYGEFFSPDHLNTLISYDHGFSGYSVQSHLPLPNFPAGREDKENAKAYELIRQLQQAFFSQIRLSPPLEQFKEACEKIQVDFATAFVQYLREWSEGSNFLFNPFRPLPQPLEKILMHYDWGKTTPKDVQSVQWTSRILDQLEVSLSQGKNPLDILKEHHWPFLSELRSVKNNSLPNELAQQISSIIDYLPPLNVSSDFSLNESARFLSAYLRMYNMDYRSFFRKDGTNEGELDTLENYWASQESFDIKKIEKEFILETPLSHEIIPQDLPLKLEDRRAGIVIEFEEKGIKQVISLAYDHSSMGLKKPILNGNYLIRLQPKLEKVPYRVRVREARQIPYPQSTQTYSYEADVLMIEQGRSEIVKTLSMNHVHETWEGYRFYLSGVGTSAGGGIKHIKLAVNYDPAKYVLTYPGGVLVFVGSILLFWIFPYRKGDSEKGR